VRVSVVVCEHSMDRYEDFQEAVDSLLAQTYDDVEIVLVSDGNDTVCEHIREDYIETDGVLVHCLDENLGLLGARNAGAEAATGDVVAFIDDDAIADENWVAELAEVYRTKDVPAAGGKMTPAWVAGKPGFLPEEFYWLIGVTHRGFGPNGDPELAGEVRNTFGSNISFRRDVFLDLGGFDTAIGGRKGDANLQGGETELCARLREEYGHGVYYNPQAEVAHKVFEYRTELSWLLDRAFWQGYSKRGMETLVPESSGEESDFLGRLLAEFLPGRIGGVVQSPSKSAAAQLGALVVLTAVVGMGYLYGLTRYPPWQ
jgi:glycosyltransferase involved in cell wall biosynthesis